MSLETAAFLLFMMALCCIIVLVLVADDGTRINTALILFLIALCTTGLGIVITLVDKKEQPKYKQEIVYSLKDGKYLPTDTLYIEIK